MTDDPPNRPPGEPKPLLDEDIAPVLARLDAWFDGHLPPDRYVFNPPATETELTAFERRVGIKLPRAYHQLYRWHDGEDDDRSGHIYGLPILPLDEAGSQWQAWVDVLAEFGGNRYQIPGGAWPAGAVTTAVSPPVAKSASKLMSAIGVTPSAREASGAAVTSVGAVGRVGRLSV